MELIPEFLILKTSRDDFVGVELTFMKRTKSHAYYVATRGSCSVIECVSIKDMEAIAKGDDTKFYINIENLHKDTEVNLAHDLECIERYRKTGEYF